MANRFWVGGTATWDATAGSKWATTSGGAGGAAVPTTGDDVFLDAASGAVTVTYGAASTFGSLDCSGFTGTLSHGAFTMSLDNSGASAVCKFVAGMTYTPTASNRIIAFINTSGTMALTSAGKTLGSLTVNGAGGTVQLQDTLSVRTVDGVITLTAGTLDGNNQNVTSAYFASTGVGLTRTLSRGSGTWNITGPIGTLWDLASAAGNLTLSAETSPLIFAATATGTRAINLGSGKTYSSVSISDAGTTQASMYTDVAWSGTPTIAALTISPGAPVRFNVSGLTLNITAATFTGTSATSVVTLLAHSATTPTLALGSTLNASWCAVGGLAFTGTTNFTNSFDLGRNTGITSFAGPSGGAAAARVIGG